MFTQIFLSEIISIAENGGQGTHFLISQILKGLTHCALTIYDALAIDDAAEISSLTNGQGDSRSRIGIESHKDISVLNPNPSLLNVGSSELFLRQCTMR